MIANSFIICQQTYKPCIDLETCVNAGMVAASLAASSCGARIIELSKRDIWSPQRIAQERPDIVFSLLAVDFLPAAVLQRSLRGVAAQVTMGLCSPLCSVMHEIGRAPAAFRIMMQVNLLLSIVFPCSVVLVM